MFGNRDIPTYLFTGFLESGKSTCIQEILEEGNFADGLKTLFLQTEEGEFEIDEKLLSDNKVVTVVIDDEDDLTEEMCVSLIKEHKPARIMIEVNGMWDLKKLINETIPENWVVVQTFTTVNAQTFDMYINNMKSLLMSHFEQSDLVIFNRCDKEMNKPSMRRNVKAINRQTIELEDDDFGLWYLDASEHPEKYVNKTMIFKGQVYRNRTFPSNAFVPARAAMTCCADDIAKIGFICHFDQAAQFDTNSWVRVKAQVKAEFSRKNQGMYPVLYADSVEKAEPPAEEVVYFS